MYEIITINCKLEQLKSVVADSMYLLSSFTSAHQAPKKLYKVKWCITVIDLVPVEQKAHMWRPVSSPLYLTVLYHFRDTTICWLTVSIFLPFLVTHRSLVWSPRKGFSWDLGYESWSILTGLPEWWWNCVTAFWSNSWAFVCRWYQLMMDGQSDGAGYAYVAL